MKYIWWPLLVVAVIAVAVLGVRDLTSASGTDYCQMANARTCKVGDRGEYVMLSMPDGTTALVLTKGGRVVQVLR